MTRTVIVIQIWNGSKYTSKMLYANGCGVFPTFKTFQTFVNNHRNLDNFLVACENLGYAMDGCGYDSKTEWEAFEGIDHIMRMYLDKEGIKITGFEYLVTCEDGKTNFLQEI